MCACCTVLKTKISQLFLVSKTDGCGNPGSVPRNWHRAHAMRQTCWYAYVRTIRRRDGLSGRAAPLLVPCAPPFPRIAGWSAGKEPQSPEFHGRWVASLAWGRRQRGARCGRSSGPFLSLFLRFWWECFLCLVLF